jgi:hypothetical protein
MIAAGVGDDAAAPVNFRKGSDLVVSATQFERADGLKIFRLEVEPAAVPDAARFVEIGRDQFCPNSNAT